MGREEFLEQLYRSMYAPLLRYAQYVLEGDALLAEEAVQEAFATAWRRIDVLMGSPNPQGWMMETLKHVIQATRRSRDKARWAAQAAEEAGEVAATDEENLDTIYGDLVGQAAYELMKEYALEHQSVDELARARGLSREACKKQLQRARKKLKKYFEKIMQRCPLKRTTRHIPSERRSQVCESPGTSWPGWAAKNSKKFCAWIPKG